LSFIAKDQVELALIAQIDYLTAENKLLREQSKNISLNNVQRKHLAELAYIPQGDFLATLTANIDNHIPLVTRKDAEPIGKIGCKEKLSDLLKKHYPQAA